MSLCCRCGAVRSRAMMTWWCLGHVTAQSACGSQLVVSWPRSSMLASTSSRCDWAVTSARSLHSETSLQLASSSCCRSCTPRQRVTPAGVEPRHQCRFTTDRASISLTVLVHDAANPHRCYSNISELSVFWDWVWLFVGPLTSRHKSQQLVDVDK